MKCHQILDAYLWCHRRKSSKIEKEGLAGACTTSKGLSAPLFLVSKLGHLFHLSWINFCISDTTKVLSLEQVRVEGATGKKKGYYQILILFCSISLGPQVQRADMKNHECTYLAILQIANWHIWW